MIRKVFLSILFSALFHFAFSGSGIIQGKVSDAATGETLVGATVIIQGTLTSTNTNLDGIFEFKNISPGNYNIIVSYISYDKKILTVELESSQTEVLDVKLETVSVKVNEVSGRKRTGIETAMIVNIKSSDLITNGISADQIKNPRIMKELQSKDPARSNSFFSCI